MVDISLEDGIRNRHSVRGFQTKQVPQDVLDKVFDLAQWSPSGTNIQPWQVYVASGEVRDKLRSQFIANIQAKEPSRADHTDKGKLAEIFKERRRECARVLFNAMGIAWEDKPARAKASFRNFEMFDAPHVAFLCMDKVFGGQSAADVGMYAQTLMLSMTAHGLGSCAQGTMAHYPDIVREAFDIPEDVKILFGISFGYEDPEIPANNARTSRAPLGESVTFLGSA